MKTPVKVDLFNKNMQAYVWEDKIRIKDIDDNYTVILLKPSDIEDISHALKALDK